MNVTNATWQVLVPDDEDDIVMQNVGDTRIAYVYAATQPGAESIVLDSDAHGVLNPGWGPFVIKGTALRGGAIYVRSLGPKAGKLYVI